MMMYFDAINLKYTDFKEFSENHESQRLLVHDGTDMGYWQYASPYYDGPHSYGFEAENQKLYLGNVRYYAFDLPHVDSSNIIKHAKDYRILDIKLVEFEEGKRVLVYDGYRWLFATMHSAGQTGQYIKPVWQAENDAFYWNKPLYFREVPRKPEPRPTVTISDISEYFGFGFC